MLEEERYEKKFGTPFETITGIGDFASKSHFYSDLICKIKREDLQLHPGVRDAESTREADQQPAAYIVLIETGSRPAAHLLCAQVQARPLAPAAQVPVAPAANYAEVFLIE
ncbi:unnamed protein product, partial [Mesorhabditis spiculigera]